MDSLPELLLDLFDRVAHDSDVMPEIPIEAGPPGSRDRQVLQGFQRMLDRLQERRRESNERYERIVNSIEREREEQYRSIFDATTDGLLIRNVEGCIVEANPALFRMHGYPRDELVGRRVVDLIHPAYHHVLQESPDAIRAGQDYHAEAVNRRKDGTSFPVEVHGAGFTYRGQPHVLAVVRDI
ncbi:MAG TPA: PAS domain S-box protein [Ardenticatenaceae bacterium]|nr:PAS domain S-box protein [Ardenticatenaceae bacterium]